MPPAEHTGWFSIPGVHEQAERTLEDQLLGLEAALASCAGKTVLDLGCAEAMISREFAKAGASRVVGIETADWSVELAKVVCGGFKVVEIIHANLNDYMRRNAVPEKFDIVLALGIVHKLPDMEAGLRWSASCAKSLYLLRPPGYAGQDGWFRNKRDTHRVHAPTVLKDEGFCETSRVSGAHNEHVEYWRRVS